MTRTQQDAIDDAVDVAALAAIADTITEITGNDDYDAVAAQAAQLGTASRRVMYAALCYTAGAEPREVLFSAVRDELAR